MLDDNLRTEILESQKAQNDLTKWKLILIAAIGASALGAVPGMPKTIILLALMPFVCIYVDTLCFHSGIRIMTIARYFRKRKKRWEEGGLTSQVLTTHTDASVVDDYEWYCRLHRRHFALEGFALVVVSLSVSLLVFYVGESRWLRGVLAIQEAADVAKTLRASGLIGLTLTLFFYLFYRSKCWWLDRMTDDEAAQQKVLARL